MTSPASKPTPARGAAHGCMGLHGAACRCTRPHRAARPCAPRHSIAPDCLKTAEEPRKTRMTRKNGKELSKGASLRPFSARASWCRMLEGVRCSASSVRLCTPLRTAACGCTRPHVLARHCTPLHRCARDCHALTAAQHERPRVPPQRGASARGAPRCRRTRRTRRKDQDTGPSGSRPLCFLALHD